MRMCKSKLVLITVLHVAAGGLAQGQTYVDPSLRAEVSTGGVARVIVETRAPALTAPVSGAFQVREILESKPGAQVGALDERAAVAKVNAGDLDRLASDPRVVAVYRDRPAFPALHDTARLTRAIPQWNSGHDGRGVTIAVLDTGIDPAHGFFKDKIVFQACFSVRDPAHGIEPLCPGGVVSDTDVVDISAMAASGCAGRDAQCDHGTHVAGIAAGAPMKDPGAPDKTIAGVAKGAQIAAIQIFSRITNPNECPMRRAPCVGAYDSSQIRALAYVRSKVLLRQATGDGPNIVAVNMSIGSGKYSAPCDASSPLTRHIRALKDENVATFVAAGNAGYYDGISMPACISAAYAITALKKPAREQDPWVFANFSNRFEDKLVAFVTFGEEIRSALPKDRFGSLSGTSMATPVAAGAYAVLKSTFPNESITTIEQAMKRTGAAVKEPASGKTLPSINIDKAYLFLAEAAAAKPATPAWGAGEPGGPDAPVARRFIVELPPGRGQAGLSAIQNASESLATKMKVDSVNASQLDADTLSVTTSRPVHHGAFADAVKDMVGRDAAVFVDRPAHIDPLPNSNR